MLLKKGSNWPHRASANLSRRPAGSSITWTSSWLAFWSKFVWGKPVKRSYDDRVAKVNCCRNCTTARPFWVWISPEKFSTRCVWTTARARVAKTYTYCEISRRSGKGAKRMRGGSFLWSRIVSQAGRDSKIDRESKRLRGLHDIFISSHLHGYHGAAVNSAETFPAGS